MLVMKYRCVMRIAVSWYVVTLYCRVWMLRCHIADLYAVAWYTVVYVRGWYCYLMLLYVGLRIVL